MRALLILIVFGIAIFRPANAAPVELSSANYYNLSSATEVLEDAGKQLTLADIRSGDPATNNFLRPGGNLLNFGFTNSAYWFRIVINNSSPTPRQMVLVLRTVWLDSIDFYQPDLSGGYTSLHDGDTQPFEQRQHPHPQFLIDLQVEPGVHTYYMRLSSKQPLMTPIELWEPDAFHQSDRQWSAYFGMLYGVLLVMVLYNGFIGYSIRSRDHLFYGLYLLTFLITNFTYSGFSFQYLWPDSPRWNNFSYAFSIYLTQVAAALFTMSFLDSRSRLPRLHLTLKIFVSTTLIAGLFALIIGEELLYNAVPIYSIFLLTPLLATAGIVAWQTGYKAARFFILATIASLTGSFVSALTVSGFLSHSFATFHAIEFGVTADVILLSLALADRINLLREQKNSAEQQFFKQKLLSHASLESAKKDLERTVLERTAELAKARDKAEQLARTDMLTGISNRRNFEEKANREFARALRYQKSLSVIMFDIDLFKQVNDKYGHAIGDQVIRRVASAAQNSVRTVDIVGRIGGEEFAILLPEASVEQAIITAERLREEIADQKFNHQEHEVSFTASFGVTQIYATDTSFDTLLRRADQAMYAAKKAGRNQVCSSSKRNTNAT